MKIVGKIERPAIKENKIISIPKKDKILLRR